jgi:septum formation protein
MTDLADHNQMPKIILASQSRARRALLKNAGVLFDSIPADLDEDGLLSAQNFGNDAARSAEFLAQQKSLHISKTHLDALVIGSDSMAVFGDEILQKAEDKSLALSRLRRLSGHQHDIVSSVCVSRNHEILWSCTDRTRLYMHEFSEEFLQHYARAAGDDLTKCAGGYSLESFGAGLFARVEGDFFTVLGLPLLPLLGYLRDQHGWYPKGNSQ